jgi:hypothetical protein
MPASFTAKAVGLQHIIANASHLAQLSPAPGDVFTVDREPNNQHDACAIVVKNAAGQKLGYVQRELAKTYALLLDAGDTITAKCATPPPSTTQPAGSRWTASITPSRPPA